jgi:hypothetical protein
MKLPLHHIILLAQPHALLTALLIMFCLATVNTAYHAFVIKQGRFLGLRRARFM